jgi:hypothetical protein
MEPDAANVMPQNLKLEGILHNDADGRVACALCSTRAEASAPSKAIVVLSKKPWSDADVRAIVEGSKTELSEYHRNDKFSKYDGWPPATMNEVRSAHHIDRNPNTTQPPPRSQPQRPSTEPPTPPRTTSNPNSNPSIQPRPQIHPTATPNPASRPTPIPTPTLPTPRSSTATQLTPTPQPTLHLPTQAGSPHPPHPFPPFPHQISITLICPANDTDIAKYSEQRRHLVRETPELHQTVTCPYIEQIPPAQLGWVQAIIERRKEMDRLLYEVRRAWSLCFFFSFMIP